MNILISNVYSWKNKGDAGIIISMIDHIKYHYPNAKISISSYDSEDYKKYNEHEFHINILSLLKNTSKKINNATLARLYNIYSLLGFKFKICLLTHLGKMGLSAFWLFDDAMAYKIESYKRYDLVIASGGGYLITTNKPRLIERILGCQDIYILCYDFYLAKLYDKPYILYNQSVGPFYQRADFKIIEKFLRAANIIICREQITYNRLKALGLNNILHGADIAFNLPSKKCDILTKYDYDDNKINIGMTLRKWLNKDDQSNFENEIQKFICEIISKNLNTHIYFMPQVIFDRAGDNDLIVYQNIYDNLSDKNKENIHIINEDIHPSELKYVISKMDYFIGTRMHSNIYSLSSNIKTIAIAYEPKTIGIMEMLGLSKYALMMQELTADILMKTFYSLNEDDEYLHTLSVGLQMIHQLNNIDITQYACGGVAPKWLVK